MNNIKVSVVLRLVILGALEMKDKIIAAAGKLFLKYGVKSITMDDIARELSISKKTIYQHFKDKSEIVELTTSRHLESEQCEYQALSEDAANAIEELYEVSKCMRRSFNQMNPSVLYDIQKYYPDAWDIWVDFKQKFIYQSVVNNLRKGITEGYFRDDITPEVLASLRVNQVEASFDDSLFPLDQLDFTEIQLQLFDHFINGILTEKGKKLYKEYQKNEDNNEPIS